MSVNKGSQVAYHEHPVMSSVDVVDYVAVAISDPDEGGASTLVVFDADRGTRYLKAAEGDGVGQYTAA